MVASDDAQASLWGTEILRKHGNAIDAAVATAWMLSVTRPHYAALGGGGFLIFCPKPDSAGQSPPCLSLDFREKAPRAAHKELYVRQGKLEPKLARDGALAAGVPGIPAGLVTALEKWGTLPRKTLLSLPIQIATQGFRMTTHEEKASTQRWESMNTEAQKIFGCIASISTSKNPARIPCAPGTLIRQPDLAKVLQDIAQKGKKGFYEGRTAQLIASGIQQGGGIITQIDLKSYEPVLREPIVTDFHGMQVITMAPPSSGGLVLAQLLGYADRAQEQGQLQNGFGAPATIHALTHAMALAFRDRAHFLGDPDAVELPKNLLTPTYLNDQWKSFDSEHAALPKPEFTPEEKHPETTHLSVVDADGNMVAMTLTINDNFGSGFVPPGTGVVMNNQMDDFSIQTGIPNLYGLVGREANAIGSGKRPLSSMTPTIIREKAGRNRLAIGAAGGPRITTSVYLTLVNRFLFGMSLRDAVAAARFHHQWIPQTLLFERFGLTPEAQTQLRSRGYTLEELPSLGKIQAVELLPNGRSSGASDPRSEGLAIAE
jgi:gamma-glutamyltranspeptidase/glutathione hydrolase